jgi:prephenate dehydrogenase
MNVDNPLIGIVGGNGRMGTWLTALLKGQGFEVLCAGRNSDLTPVMMARQCDVVIVSVLISDMEEVIRNIGPAVAEDRLLMDVASVKKMPVQAMLRYSDAQVVGLHPLFGPEDSEKPGSRIAISPGRGESGLNWIKGVFEKQGFEITIIDPETHDRMMGLIQGVNHFSTLALAWCIRESGFDLEDIKALSTQTFLERLDRIGSITKQPEALFKSLLMDNPDAMACIHHYQQSVNCLNNMIRDGKKSLFERFFRSLRETFRENLEYELE